MWRTAVVLVISAAVWLTVAERQSEQLFLLDAGLGLLALVLSFFRRRWPLPIAVVTAALTSVSALASGPATLASVSVATRRRWAEVLTAAAVGMAAAHVFPFVQPVEDEPLWLTFAVSLLATAAMMAWGMYIGSRRELMWTLRHRAERAEAEQELRVAQSRSNERERIAREMHDVLAHRISQISMHAGALAFREDLTADEMRDSAGVIQAKAHEALTDLRGVLGVLRDEAGELTQRAACRRTPTCRRWWTRPAGPGWRSTLDDRLPVDEPVPDAAGRTIYRIVQEGLTNAHKHAPGLDADDRAQRLARGRHRRGAPQPARVRQHHTRRGPRPGRADRARRAARRPPRARPRRVGVRPARLDTVGGVTHPGRRWSTTTRWSAARSP